MPLLVAAATGRELAAALASFGRIDPPEGPWDGPVPLEAAGRRLLLAVTGVGPVAAALCLGRVLGRGGVRGVVFLGLCGSFDLEALPLGAVCLAASETWPDFGLYGPEGPDAAALGFPQALLGGREVRDVLPLAPRRAAQALGLALRPDWPEAAGTTVAAASGTPERAAVLRARGGAMENMEGFAAALACGLAQVPCLEVRAVSNRVGARPPRDWDAPGALAALGRAFRFLLTGPQ